jgi:aconitate hydratase
MVNGLGVLGWGVGGIEAEAAMLGEPLSMLVPRVVGFRLSGALPEGTTATDLVLTVAELLRGHGVVGKFVEFFGPGVASVPLENRATIGNMSPEYGSTCSIFPVDDETIRYLRFTGRSEERVALVEAYAKEQGLWHDDSSPTPQYSEVVELDLSTVTPSLAGPARPQDRVPLERAKQMFGTAVAASMPTPVSVSSSLSARSAPDGPDEASAESFPASDPPAAMAGTDPSDRQHDGVPEPAAPDAWRSAHDPVPVKLADGRELTIDDGHVVIAAITSCTNTSNPSVMIAAGLLARNAVDRGLASRPWVKTTLAPGSRVVVEYYERAGLTPYLEKLGFDLVGFGCTTCIGNSGPLLPEISAAVNDNDLSVCSVLSGNRNFEGRIHPDCRMNYLASPPLVVAYALAGTMDWDPYHEPIGHDGDGNDVYLRDLWPSSAEVSEVVRAAVRSDMFTSAYGDVFHGDDRWRGIDVTGSATYPWNAESTYVRQPPFFDGLTRDPAPLTDVQRARVLAVLGDSVTTDHISPAGVIRPDGPAGRWLTDHGVARADFNSYGSRRGNHEVMMRGTFANTRLRNKMVPGVEGGVTRHLPDRGADVRVGHPRLDADAAVVEVDLEDALHPGEHEQHAVLDGQRAAAQPRAGPACDPGDVLARARAHDRLDLLGRRGQDGGGRRRVVLEQAVGLVGPQLVLLRVDPFVAGDRPQLLDQAGDVLRRLARRLLDPRRALGGRLYTTIHDNTAVDCK